MDRRPLMTVRRRGQRWAVEVYDSSLSSHKRYVGTFDTKPEAREAERRAEVDVARRRGKRGDETVACWAARWLDLRPRQKESTNIAYREQVAPFATAHGERRLPDVTVEPARSPSVCHLPAPSPISPPAQRSAPPPRQGRGEARGAAGRCRALRACRSAPSRRVQPHARGSAAAHGHPVRGSFE